MRLYHYTALNHVQGILAQGLTLGFWVEPMDEPPYWKGRQGWQWLTDSEEWHQPWATDIMGTGEDRSEYRFRVIVPHSHMPRLHRFTDLAAAAAWPQERLEEFTRGNGMPAGEASHWYVYHGYIRPGWLRQPERRPVDTSTVSVPFVAPRSVRRVAVPE